jgi:hypothetical protein
MTEINGYRVKDLAELLVRISNVDISVECATNMIINAARTFLEN